MSEAEKLGEAVSTEGCRPETAPVAASERDSLTLKWGTLKACDIKTESAWAAAQKYFDAGEQSAGAMTQHDAPEQKAALCDLIDAVNCETIDNDWTGEAMSKDAAKSYVMEYGK